MLPHLTSNPQFGNPHQLLALTQNAQTHRNTHAYSFLKALCPQPRLQDPFQFQVPAGTGGGKNEMKAFPKQRLWPPTGLGVA